MAPLTSFDRFVKPGYPYGEYAVEVEAVALGLKPAHYGYYHHETPLHPLRDEAAATIALARSFPGLLVQKGPGSTDYIVVPRGEEGEATALAIFRLARRIRRDPDAIDDLSLHYAFSRFLGYEEDLARAMVAIAGPDELERRRFFRHCVDIALAKGEAIPEEAARDARRMFPGIRLP